MQFDLSRSGDRSVYGDVRVTKPGTAEPVVVAKGIAVYPELKQRVVSLPLTKDQADKLKGDVTIGYYETADAGGALIAQVKTVIR